ncbi:MAG TPA: sulfite exporter TauE/SafE family protein, partial [Nitrospirae bacterium]|nr:sulfite exporter TauE/SafE family protein [Nitrospirota bacterium]
MKNKRFWAMVSLLAILSIFIFYNSPAYADKLADAIAATPQGAEKGMINPDAAKGFLGIPGAP